MKLFVEDLDRDCSALSLRARGAWVWLMFDLRNHGGIRTLPIHEWAGVVRASEEDFLEGLSEVICQGVCDAKIDGVTVEVTPSERYEKRYENVTQALRRNGLSQKNNAEVTVICRRLVRESKTKSANALRQERHREKLKSNAQSNAPRNASVTAKKQKQKQITEAETRAGATIFSGSRGSNGGGVTEVTRAPSDRPVFELTEKLKAWARTIVPDLDLEAEFLKFEAHARATGRRAADWEAAFQKWLLDAPGFNRSSGGRSPPAAVTREENNSAAIAEAMNMLGQGRSP